MIESIFYAVLAILGLGFLVFIHELGHYLVARRNGMKVEAFAIGFGKPIYTWVRDGVKWHICMLPFGGYVKIAGMQKENGVEPADIPNGFYGKSPWKRIQVAFAGPLVNIVFAFVVFSFIWVLGGRDKSFAEFTHSIGWVDPKSQLYEKGIRPGDIITRYNGREFQGFRDLMISSLMKKDFAQISGYKIDALTGEQTSFDYTLKTYADPRSPKENLNTIGVLSPAQYLIYAPKEESSVMKEIGLLAKDRLLWVDGEIVYSLKQLSSLVNSSTAFMTVQRDGRIFQTKVPRVLLNDFKMSAVDKAEIGDWQHEAGLKSRFQDLYFIPYNLSPSCKVEGRFAFIDELDQRQAFDSCERCSYFYPLEEGDLILAVDGISVSNSYELLHLLQTRRVLTIVDRDPSQEAIVSLQKADTQFEDIARKDLEALIASIGTGRPVLVSGRYHTLQPMIPKTMGQMPLTSLQKKQMSQEMERAKKEIASVSDPQKRGEMMRELEENQKRLVLGLSLKDREVLYNPTPIAQFSSVFEDTWRTLSGLVSGTLNPKYVSGPVGIVHVVHQSWMIGVKEALFWMGVISLNLGFVNLLPIPVLDGGHIVISLFEMVTKRRLKAKTMERLIVPFIVLLLGLFVYITFQDIARLVSKFF